MGGSLLAIALTGALAACGWLSYRYPWWRRAVDSAHPRILMYHMIANPADAGPIPNLAVAPAMFERQIAHLKRTGWHFATISELFCNPLPAKTVAITFDDGYRDNLTHALPILLRHQAKATVYLIADREHPLAEGGRPDGEPLAPLLSNGEVVELLASNAVELGAHTLTHRNLTTADESVQRHELMEGKRALENTFSRSVSAFAYPFGSMNHRLLTQVAAAGYTSAATTNPGISTDLAADRLQLKRIKVSGRDNFATFRIRLRIGRKR